jgi:two-component system sensor histidine kinase RegB
MTFGPSESPRRDSDVERGSDAYEINFSWLLRLRWGAMVGELVVISAVHYGLGVRLPLSPLGLVVALQIATNLGCWLWLLRRPAVSEWHVGSLVALDIVLFTAILYFTGGPTNSFSFLYLVYIALAALVLRPRWTWALVALTLLCSGALFVEHVPIEPGAAHAAHHHDPGMHYQGMWVALGVAASFIVYFLHRVTSELAEREAELARVREQTAHHERLASLATLAAGAAHELASPLSTIAVVSKELARALTGSADQATMTDVALIRAEVERCREILAQKAADAGQPTADAVSALSAVELADAARAGLPDRIDVSIGEVAQSSSLVAPRRALSRAVRNLLVNALDVSPELSSIELAIDRTPEAWLIRVSDRGPGMSAEVRRRAVEPFYTTKGAGRGMGLGLFLCKSVAEQLGGRLQLDSRPEGGTVATMVIPDRRDDESAASATPPILSPKPA